MNKRILNVDVNINGLRVVKYQDATQYDKNTHFIGVSFMDNIDLVDYTLQVYYLPPFPSTTPFVDMFDNLTQTMEIPIPNRVLQRNGEVTVEFVLSKGEELITVNQNFNFEVIKTINGTSLTAYPEGTIKETIAHQIEKIKALLAQTDVKIKEYDDNALSKTNSFNDNAKTKTNNFNNNVQAKTTEFDRYSSEIVNQAYQDMEEQARVSANSAATKANELVVVQQNKSIKEVQTATTESKNNAISEIERKTLEQVEVVKTQGTTSKGEVEQAGTTAIDNINTTKNQVINSIDTSKNSAIQALNDEKVKQIQAITDQGDLTRQGVVEEGKKVVKANKTELDTYVNNTSKVQIDNYINTTSKENIDDYVIQKESEIIGATYTPSIDEEGNLSWTNDKNLENPASKNIKGPQGAKGDKPVKGVDYFTKEEEQQFTESTVNKVNSEGNKQIGLIKTETTNVIEKVKEIVAGNEAISNALTLSGKARLEFEKETQGVAGGYNGTFPLTQAILNGIYLLPATGKFYVCTKAYSGGSLTAPNANFEELSVFKNRDKLENLFGFKLLKSFTSSEFNQEITVINWNELPLSKDDRYFLEIIVIASYEFPPFGKSRMSVIKIAFPYAQLKGKEIYITTGASDKVTLKYDWFTGSIKAILTDTTIYFKVYGLKISS